MLLAYCFVAVCFAAYLFRRAIFNCIGSLLYTMIKKSIESCAGKILVETAQPIADEEINGNGALQYPLVTHGAGAGFMINAKMVGQNFDLNAKRNARYCTPDASQDLYPSNDLA